MQLRECWHHDVFRVSMVTDDWEVTEEYAQDVSYTDPKVTIQDVPEYDQCVQFCVVTIHFICL